MNEIAYQNKDITSKIFAEKFKGKSLKVYGIDIPEIVQVLPTNLPEIRANELRLDNIFLLQDDSIAIIDYESAYKKENNIKYMNYIGRIFSHYYQEWKRDIKIRMIVIYTADITRKEDMNLFDVGCLKLEINAAYLAELNSSEISERLNQKIQSKQTLTEEEMMEFIILPLTYKGTEEKNKCISTSIQLAKQILDEETKVFVLSGIAVFADKVISEENASIIRRLLSMTKVGQLFEEEKQEYAREYAKEYANKKVFKNTVVWYRKGKITALEAAQELNMSEETFLEAEKQIEK